MPCAVASAARVAVDGAHSDYRLYALSEREEQILKTLVHGYSNKTIAHMHSVTEATKDPYEGHLAEESLANRSQAAIWPSGTLTFRKNQMERATTLNGHRV
jgi:FixJ family two-component response regulator